MGLALYRTPATACRVHRAGVPVQEVAHPDHRLPGRRPRAHHNGLRVRVLVNVPQWSALLSLLWWSQVRQRHANDVTQERLHGTQRIRSMLKLLPQVSLDLLKLLPQVSLVVAVAPLRRNRPTGPCGACAASPDDSALCDSTKCPAARWSGGISSYCRGADGCSVRSRVAATAACAVRARVAVASGV